ncbi:MAG: DUF1697 domain-containing protein [Siphonobacter aquaeclarae]|nr:DUF1697 domain-containing protein [Siphonobacter aquaeclarae]
MKRVLAMLRGINVSGRNRVPMADLKAFFEAQGHTDVRTYIQSGNVVFSPGASLSQLESQLFGHFGFEIPVLMRTTPEMEALVANNPFLLEEDIATDKLHVTFLEELPAKDAVSRLETLSFLPDRFIISGKEVYVYCPDGYGNTKIHNMFFEKKLGVRATTRNWKSVNELLSMLNAK